MQLSGDPCQTCRLNAPFVTSVGRITVLIRHNSSDNEEKPTWTITDVGNSFTVRFHRPVMHLWEWQGRTTIKFVATSEFVATSAYDEEYPIRQLRDEVQALISGLLTR